MDIELLKSALPFAGGALALVGGALTFVSGRLRDAPDEDAKANVVGLAWVWVAVGLWVIGSAVGIATGYRLVAALFFVAGFIIQWCLFVSGPEPAPRKSVAVFALSCAVIMSVVLFAFFAQMLDQVNEVQRKQVELLQDIIQTMKKSSQ